MLLNDKYNIRHGKCSASLFNWFKDEESFSNGIKRKGSNSLENY